MKILVFVLTLLASGLASSEELRFSNKIPWLLAIAHEWRVCYYVDSSVSTDIREVPVRFANNKAYCDFADGPAVSGGLYNNREGRVCNLRKDERGNWYVPKLSNVVFDLLGLKGLKIDMVVAFISQDVAAGFNDELKPGQKNERLVERDLIMQVYLGNPLDMKDLKQIGVFLVADANHGVVTLEGDLQDKWSMKLSWSPSGAGQVTNGAGLPAQPTK